MIVRITQIDGKLPNLALMRISAWHKAQGDEVRFERSVTRAFDEPAYDRVYGSAIFETSMKKVDLFRSQFPDAIIGGSGVDGHLPQEQQQTVERTLKAKASFVDYGIDPSFAASIGYTQRGCRLKCKFCVVPRKEGKPVSVGTIHDIWRGKGHPKKLHLLDNDFFGQDEAEWRARIEEIGAGGFRVSFTQGINVRAITDASAAALASIEYRNTAFDRRLLYTAWDNLKDEEVFFEGITKLEKAGIPASHVMAYMLIGFDKKETWDRIHHRFDRMRERGVLPFVMVFDPKRKDLKRFQRWSNTGLYRIVPNFADYDAGASSDKPVGTPLLEWREAA